jgi:hypothetical protein
VDNSWTQLGAAFQRGQDGRDEGVLTVMIERRSSALDHGKFAGG